ncbi:hypothetical protein N7541_001053 [Penicillium brevicompactum]|uniref:Zn(2)-C6 fungal-type domain-containing protein n=1 Tax=Penicillium brevicompactum TaxID=5074 RepID=A0A9W9RVK1_PENBR|nr:hypothetical protein N7541_001053 [Penicillium brevicompactum]
MPPDSKTKIRPQQSCLKCRERKVKCDRSIPCHACIIRGIEAECTYTATAEDRAHISQADIIERLRREVSQLRGKLNQPREQNRPPKSWRAHPYAPASGSKYKNNAHGEREGSWSGSSPSSTTMTGSANVTSPDSTGSDNGASVSSRSVSMSVSVSASGSVPAPAAPSASAVAPYSYAPQAEEGPIGGLSVLQVPCASTNLPYGGFADLNVPMQGPVHGLTDTMPSALYMPDNPLYYPTYAPMPSYTDPIPEPQWKGTYGDMSQLPTVPVQPYASQYSSMNSYGMASTSTSASASMNTTTNPSQADASLSSDTSSHASPISDRLSPTIMNSIPSSWRGEGKKAVLEALLETISSCDESQVSQVIHVVRTSPTPEDAVSGICQVLGLGNGW